MKKWLRRILGAVGMGLTWAMGWGIIGVLIGVFVDPDGSMDEMWVLVGAYPGFIGGVVFFTVLGIAACGRRLHELSLSRIGVWGVAAGLLPGLFPSVVTALMVARTEYEYPLWLLGVVIFGATTLMSVVLAVGSALVFRYAARGKTPASG